MKFIVIEGLDGSGKTTQIELLKDFLSTKGIPSKFLHFPRPESPIYGPLISRFLRGEFGDIDQVDPYLVALLYAGDRKDASNMIQQWLKDGYAVIADRYLYSNIGFQCAKVEDKSKRTELAKWIKHLEYEYNKIPVPDLNLFLKVPAHFTQMSLTSRREGADRDYLDGAEDIHESDLGFQQQVRNVYLDQVESNEDFELIDCQGENDAMLAPEEVFAKIENRLLQIFN